jgi:hypothetical protein
MVWVQRLKNLILLLQGLYCDRKHMSVFFYNVLKINPNNVSIGNDAESFSRSSHSPPVDPILSQMNPVSTLTHYFVED